MTRTEYWNKYGGRREDAFYRPAASSPSGYVNVNCPWQGDLDEEQNFKSPWILWSKEFWYFADAYCLGNKRPTGLKLSPPFDVLAKPGMRDPGHLIWVPDTFVSWVKNHRSKKQLVSLYSCKSVLRDFVTKRKRGCS